MELNVQKIRKELKRREWTVRQLSERLGVSFQSIYSALTNKSTKLSTITKIADALELDPRDLII